MGYVKAGGAKIGESLWRLLKAIADKDFSSAGTRPTVMGAAGIYGKNLSLALVKVIGFLGGDVALKTTKKVSEAINKGVLKAYKTVMKKLPKDSMLKNALREHMHQSKTERFFRCLTALAIFTESAAIVSDMMLLKNDAEKRDSIADHSGNIISYLVYLNKAFGKYAAFWDVGAMTLRLIGNKNTPDSGEVFGTLISYGMAAAVGGYKFHDITLNPTELSIREIEEAYQIPLAPLDVDRYLTMKDENLALSEATATTMEGLGRIVGTIYLSHRRLNENKVDKFFSKSFGQRSGDYWKMYASLMASYGKVFYGLKKDAAAQVDNEPLTSEDNLE